MLRLNELLSKRISYDFLAELAVTKAATGGVLWKKMFLKISQISQGNTCVGSLFNKVAGLRPVTLLKRDSNAGVFLWSLRKF